tara:strand:+ start:361 stop:531 length:171 start_codon:yes stop_codon:yes gene_type:complete
MVGKKLVFNVDGKMVSATVREVRKKCKQYPQGAVYAVNGEYLYTLDPSGGFTYSAK